MEKSQIAIEGADYKRMPTDSNRAFMLILSICVLLLLAISIIYINELKLSLKEMIDTIKVIASGEVTSVIDTSSNTKFGNMSKQLNAMRNSIAVE